MQVRLNSDDVNILMEAQYRFPVTPEPFRDMAEALGMDEEQLLGSLRRLKELRVVKRIGYYLNYRSQRRVAALVALRVPGPSLEAFKQLTRSDRDVTHSYLRDHPWYNVWIVVKKDSRGELEGYVEELARRVGAEDYAVLYGKRTYKLSVKFDLRRGVSWSLQGRLPEKVPSIEDLGIPMALVMDLRRGLPLKPRPYEEIASRYGLGVEELLGLVEELLAKGVLGDPGAALDGEKLGFRSNAMVVLPCEDCCEWVASNAAEATHVVLRETVPGKWEYPCYFMVHARRRDTALEVAHRVSESLGVEASPIFSLENLKPGVVR